MEIDFSKIEIGTEYERNELAKIWGYKSFQALARGVFTPRESRKIVLFITNEKQEKLVQYQDSFENGILEMEGEISHQSDARILEAKKIGDEIHLFYREIHHSLFQYCGIVEVTKFRINTSSPSHFTLKVVSEAVDEDIYTETAAHGYLNEVLEPDEEGRARNRVHITYERSKKNRKIALEIHGTSCKVCGFDFNRIYGVDFARNFIEIHHVVSIAKGIRRINPMTDLIPLCSNCHSMAHRKKGVILSCDEIRKLISKKSESYSHDV